MAYNIFERWPFTSFQNLNLDWLMKATKEAVETANEAAGSVGQFDDRITANSDAIAQLEIDMDAISSTARVTVNSELEAYYRGAHITGAALRSMMQEHGDLPFVEYDGEVYMLDTVSNAGDLRFSMCHTVDVLNELVIRHILIPAQSSNAAYSITNVSAGGGSANTLIVTITYNPLAPSDYSSDHSYAEINSALQAGKAILLNIAGTGTDAIRATSAMVQRTTVTVSGQSVGAFMFLDPEALNSSAPDIHYYVIREDGEVYYLQKYNDLVNMATLLANAVSVYPQELTAAQKATARTNIGASTGTIPVIANTDSAVQIIIDPNKFYVFPNAGQLSIDLHTGTAGIVNEHHFRFVSGSTATQLDLPAAVVIPDDFDVTTNTVYEVSIIDNYMVYSSWAVSTP